MKKLIFCSLLGISFSAFATNGSHFISVTPAGGALGGTGVANFTNSLDALYRNPALLDHANLGGNVNGEISFRYIKNNVSTNAGLGLKDSTAGAKFSPSLGAAYAYNDKLAVGLGLLTYGGATVDQNGQTELNQLKARLTLIRLVPSITYKVSDMVAVSVAPYVSYGSLQVNHSNPPSSTGAQTTTAPHAVATISGQIGAAFYPTKGLTLGLTYNFEANHRYKEIMNLDAFGPAALSAGTAAATAALDDIDAQEPAELAIGAGYEITPDLKVTADFRHISWNTARAFKELSWQNQSVIAFGAQYKHAAWLFRAGFNYGKSPIQDVAGEAGLTPVNFQGHQVFQQSLSLLDMGAFPALTESHVTFGAGYDVNQNLHLDLDLMLALKKTVTRAGTGSTAYSFTTEASQFALGLGAVYRI